MAQRRYLNPLARRLGSVRSRLWTSADESPAISGLWREILLRAESLTVQGGADDPEVIARGPKIQQLMAEIEVVKWMEYSYGHPGRNN